VSSTWQTVTISWVALLDLSPRGAAAQRISIDIEDNAITTLRPARTGNRLLDRLSAVTADFLLRSSRRVADPQGHEVCRQGGPILYVCFPTTSLYSIVIDGQGGERIEAATVGNEGMVGLSLHLGLETSSQTAILQVPGEAIRVQTNAFLTAVKTDPEFNRLMQRYTAYSLRYTSQTVACNALHSLEERTCRWWLMTHDGIGRDDFTLTHEFLAEMLGVRRQSVSLAAGALQRSGLVTYRRGRIRIINRRGLEATACECYEVLRSLYEQIVT
jgi:CRP-like cAMP-binding protein